MTFKTFVKDSSGTPIIDIFVIANDLNNGESFSRSTDGGGYADVAMLGSCQVGDHVTLVVLDPQLRFKGAVFGDAFLITADDQLLELTLNPFG